MNTQGTTTLTLPSTSGTLATLDDLVPGLNSVTTNQVVDGTILTIDIQDNSISSADIAGFDASKVTTGVFNPLRLPNRDIADVTNLQTTINTKISKNTQIIDNLTTDSATEVLSANQGNVLQTLINSWTPIFSSRNEVLAGVDLDFEDVHSVLSKTLNSNTTFTVSNLNQGHRIVLLMNGNFIANFPSEVTVLEGSYNGALTNVVELEVMSDIAGSEFIAARIYNI